jgi:hypothetical protein
MPHYTYICIFAPDILRMAKWVAETFRWLKYNKIVFIKLYNKLVIHNKFYTNNKYMEFGIYLNILRILIYFCFNKRKIKLICFIHYLEKAADRTPFGKPTHRWQNNINIFFKGMGQSALAKAIVRHTCTSRYAKFEYQPNNKYNCIFGPTNLKMATWIAETCRWLLYNKIVFIKPK